MTTTTPTPATLDDLEAVDAGTIDPYDLCAAIARILGWKDVSRHGRFGSYKGISPGGSIPICVPDFDRDGRVALLLLAHLTEFGWRLAFEPEQTELYRRGTESEGWEGVDWVRVGAWGHGNTRAGFCLSICRAYLLAWQAERRAEREGAK